MRTKATWTALVLALATACGGETTMTTDDAGTGDAGPGDSGVRPDTGTMMTGDGNDSFADADPIEFGTTVMDSIRRPGDEDYFSFTGTAGQWIWITTSANPDDDPDMVDTVVTLYDSSMNQIAENDDAVPRVNTDSELITRLPANGTYYVLVQEFSAWAGDTPEGMASFTYELDVNPLPMTAAINVDMEENDDAASAQALGWQTTTSGAEVNIVVGTAQSGTDVDVYSFSMVAARPYARFVIMPPGTGGYGTTGQPVRLWITNAAGDEVIARIDTTQLTEIEPSLPPGEYRLWVDHPAATGSNDFYVLKGYKLQDNPAETMELTNDLVATPEAIAFMAGAQPMTRTGFVLATLGDADTDHYSIDVMAGERVNVFCGSRTSGSGVVGLQAALMDATGTTTIAMASETPTMAIAIQNAMVPAAGTYLLRLTKTSQDAEVTGDWVRCGILLGPPTTP